jgi:hypothetical protein
LPPVFEVSNNVDEMIKFDNLSDPAAGGPARSGMSVPLHYYCSQAFRCVQPGDAWEIYYAIMDPSHRYRIPSIHMAWILVTNNMIWSDFHNTLPTNGKFEMPGPRGVYPNPAM